MNIKKTVVASAVVASLAAAVTPTQADIVDFSWSGNYTFLNPTGNFVVNADYSSTYPYYGFRSPISGTLQFNTATGAGTGSIEAFNFFGSGPGVFHDINMQTIGDGFGGAGSLVLASMLYDWGGNNDIEISVVLDAGGLFAALPLMTIGDTINQTTCAVAGSGCILAASDGTKSGLGTRNSPYYTYPMGAIPIATTTYNVNNAGTAIGGGTYTDATGLHTYAANDAIGGSHLDHGPFIGFNANFDFTAVTLTGITVVENFVPVPAAVWLFGSGLIGLAGMARRRKN